MLNIYKSLFEELNKTTCVYCVYKSLNFLDQDLLGLRGDLDIIVQESDISRFIDVAEKVGFRRGKQYAGFPQYYVARDPESGRFVMIDLDICVRFGAKPVRPYRLHPDWSKIGIDYMDGVPVLSKVDYIPLMLLTRVTSSSPKEVDFFEIADSLKAGAGTNWLASSFGAMAAEIKHKGRSLIDSVQLHNGWSGLQEEFRSKTIDSLAGGQSMASSKVIVPSIRYGLSRLSYIVRRVFGCPAYRVRKRGLMVAFVGVDGAGKSSTVDTVLADHFYQVSGIKRIYFGSNEFWIPGALRLNTLLNDIPGIKYLPRFLLLLDRQLRVLRALYFCFMGNMVVCDRYYYDDIVMRRLATEGAGDQSAGAQFFDKVKAFFRPRMLLRPYLTLYLDVSPEVAYARKQDYSFDVMLRTNAMYKKVMATYDEVVFIDADQPEKDVHRMVFEQLQNVR